MAPRKHGKGDKMPPVPRAGKDGKLDWLTQFYPQADGDTYYRIVNSPMEFMLLMMNDERLPLGQRAWAAQSILPYYHAKVAPKPYIPTDAERQALEEEQRLTIEIIEFKEIAQGDT